MISKSADIGILEFQDANQAWLTDMAIRLVCVIALDRFSDFNSDQVTIF